MGRIGHTGEQHVATGARHVSREPPQLQRVAAVKLLTIQSRVPGAMSHCLCAIA